MEVVACKPLKIESLEGTVAAGALRFLSSSKGTVKEYGAPGNLDVEVVQSGRGWGSPDASKCVFTIPGKIAPYGSLDYTTALANKGFPTCLKKLKFTSGATYAVRMRAAKSSAYLAGAWALDFLLAPGCRIPGATNCTAG
jgi:hypothetical protein